MKHELAQLDEIISVLFNPAKPVSQKNRVSYIKACQESVMAESLRILQQWKLARFTIECERQFLCYVQYNQHVITVLLDRLFSDHNSKGNPAYGSLPALKGIADYLKRIQDTVVQLFNFLLCYYNRFIDPMCKIPNREKEIFTRELKLFTRKIKQAFLSHAVDDELAGILIKPFELCMAENESTYGHYDYLKKLRSAILGCMEKSEINNTSICRMLIRQHYNGEDFYTYYLKKLSAHDESISHPSSLSEKYYYELKLIHQLPKAGMQRYLPGEPCIREQLSTWLAEEICFLEKKQYLGAVPASHESAGHESAHTATKVHTDLSVDHLSVAVKLLMDTGIIKNKNTAEMIRLVARNFRTKNSEQISEISLRNKLYNIESSSARAVQHVIVDLLNAVRKY